MPATCHDGADMIGRWRITQADLWDQNYLDLCGPTTLLITADGHGEIGFNFHNGDEAVLKAVKI